MASKSHAHVRRGAHSDGREPGYGTRYRRGHRPRRRDRGRVHGLYVVDTRDYSTVPESTWLSLREELESAGEEALAAVERRAAATGVPVTTAVSRGVPYEEILEYAARNGVDVVVMGTHGRTGVDRFLLGSVTEKVIRRATMPVLVVNIGDDAT